MEDTTDAELIRNAVRQMIGQCRSNEDAIKRDLAFEQVYGSEKEAARHLELLNLQGEATNAYIALLERL